VSEIDPVISKGDDAGRLESELFEIVFNPEISDLEYFLSRKRHFERKQQERGGERTKL
jgi:hypothetical protein